MTLTPKSLVMRRDELIEEIVEILRVRLAGVPFTVEEHVALQKAIAHFIDDVIGESLMQRRPE